MNQTGEGMGAERGSPVGCRAAARCSQGASGRRSAGDETWGSACRPSGRIASGCGVADLLLFRSLSAHAPMFHVQIAGLGRYLPPRVVPSAEVEALCGVPTGWAEANAGVRERRWVGGETASEMSAAASREALAAAGMLGDRPRSGPKRLGDARADAPRRRRAAAPRARAERRPGLRRPPRRAWASSRRSTPPRALLATGAYRRVLVSCADIRLGGAGRVGARERRPARRRRRGGHPHRDPRGPGVGHRGGPLRDVLGGRRHHGDSAGGGSRLHPSRVGPPRRRRPVLDGRAGGAASHPPPCRAVPRGAPAGPVAQPRRRRPGRACTRPAAPASAS